MHIITSLLISILSIACYHLVTHRRRTVLVKLGPRAEVLYAVHGPLKPAYKDDAGTDIRVCLPDLQDPFILRSTKVSTITIAPGEKVDLPTDVYIKSPKGFWFEMRARSSTVKDGIDVKQNTIDEGFTGELQIMVQNVVDHPVKIEHGQRLAQLVFKRRHSFAFKYINDLPKTHRGSNCFGSSGKK